MSRPTRPEGFYELRRLVAANIRTARQHRGWTLQRVADDLAPYLGQMGASTIAAWEASRHDGAKGFTIEELYALCRVFLLDFADILAPPTLLDMDPVRLPDPNVIPFMFTPYAFQRLKAKWDDYDKESV